MTTLHVRTERKCVSTKGGSRHAVVTIGAPRLEGGKPRSPMNLAFVLDRSGSMGHEKLGLAKGAVGEAMRRLVATDRFAVVTYDDKVEIPVPSTPAGRAAVADAERALSLVEARGSTDLCSGWLTGCREIARHPGGGQVARCMLFTDGLANQGEMNMDVLAGHARELRARGIATTTFGIGADFDEHLLRRIADEGGGSARFIESQADFSRLVNAELRDTLDVVHKDLVLRIVVSGAAELEPIGPWRVERDGRGLRIRLGDVVSEEELEIVLRAHLGAAAEGGTVRLTFSLEDRDGPVASEHPTLTWTVVHSPENRAQPRDVAVDRIVAARHAARAREHAVLANRRREWGEAERLLRRVADRIGQYAGEDPELRAIVNALLADAETYGRPMSAIDQKREYYRTSQASRGKLEDGSSKRR